MNFTPRNHRLTTFAGLMLAAASLAAQAQSTSTDPGLPTQPAGTDPATSSASPASAGTRATATPGIGYGVDANAPSTSSSGSAVTAQASGSSTMSSAGEGYSLLPYTRRGYFGLNLGQAEFDTDCGTGGYACDDPSVAGYLYTGGMISDWLGAEIGYYNSGRADRAGGGTRAQGLNLSAVLRLPLGAFNVFAKGGAIYGETRVSTGSLSDVSDGKRHGWGGSYGAGLGFDFTPTSGLVLEWSRYQFRFPGDDDREDVDTTTLGYIHRF